MVGTRALLFHTERYRFIQENLSKRHALRNTQALIKPTCLLQEQSSALLNNAVSKTNIAGSLYLGIVGPVLLNAAERPTAMAAPTATWTTATLRRSLLEKLCMCPNFPLSPPHPAHQLHGMPICTLWLSQLRSMHSDLSSIMTLKRLKTQFVFKNHATSVNYSVASSSSSSNSNVILKQVSWELEDPWRLLYPCKSEHLEQPQTSPQVPHGFIWIPPLWLDGP